MTEEKVSNTFQDMEDKKNSSEPVPQEAHKSSGEIDINDFSDTAVGDKVKYVRPNLAGKEDVIEKFQVFQPDTSKPAEPYGLKKTAKAWKAQMVMYFESKNEEGVQNKEYISGAISFENRDGDASDLQFWYDGGETQSCYMWELVAEHLGIEPERLSPRQFIAFMNSKPKVKLYAQKTKNFNSRDPNAPKHIYKNMPESFVK